jgi:phage terminase large subunit-like protein
MAGLSLWARAAQATPGGAEALARRLGATNAEAVTRIWGAMARPEQLAPPGDWKTVLWLAGRGFGKTACLSGWVHDLVEDGRYGRFALVAPTSADARDTLVEGPAGVLQWAPPHRPRPHYQPSKRKITFWNGVVAFTFSAEEPDRLRGPQFHAAACDELAAWKYPETWDMLQFGLRLGSNPRVAIATTPRPIPMLRELVRDPDTVVIKGSTFDNACNLAPQFLEVMRKRYEGTRLGRQELNAEILDDNPNALWAQARIDDLRVKQAPDFRRVTIGIDPAVSHDPSSNETGIIGAGLATCACQGKPDLHAFVFSDRSGVYTPAEWAREAIGLYCERSADRVVAEVNQGGDLVEANLRANGGERLSYRAVHAAKGKHTRAEPIAALYEQGKVHHIGCFPKLEDQMTQWDPLTDEKSPDRLDALVWVLTDLMLGAQGVPYSRPNRPLATRRI